MQPEGKPSSCNEIFQRTYGWKVTFDHQFKEKRSQYIRPRMKQLPELLGMGIRYLPWYIKIRKQKRKPFIDGFKQLPVEQIYGVPIGGIGSGTIGRGFKGEFCRFQFTPGIYEHNVVVANQFIVCIRKNDCTIYQKVLSPLKPKKVLHSWNWEFDGSQADYRGLYPRAWYTYDIPEHKVQLVCRQISPIIPNNYKDSTLPVAVFVWSIQNLGSEPVDVSIAFTFKNGTGSSRDRHGGCWTEPFNEANEANPAINVKGVLLYQKIKQIDCTVAISALEVEEKVKVTHSNSFNPNGSGNDFWQDLFQDGKLDGGKGKSKKTSKGEEIACAVCAQCSVDGNSTEEMKFNISWHMPVITFPQRKLTHKRRYTRWFDSAASLSAYALSNYSSWEKSIDDWQNPILEDESLPDWYKSALFNELYFISDGGTLWVEFNENIKDPKDVQPGDERPEFGHFAYLEGHEYRMYNTYDVHYYASFALLMLWPKLQFSLQYDLKDATIAEDTRREKFLMNGISGMRKSGNSVPHDIGDPEEEPWHNLNAYVVHDTSEWRDLNTKFVLQTYRDYVASADENYLRNMWPTVVNVMSKCLTWDYNNDGLIENSGTADQTYDCWVMTGPSAYCGGLWLAALCVTCLMAKKLKDSHEEEKYKKILENAQKAYEKLWTGSYYKFDGSGSSKSLSIMADQLCGYWYLKACGVEEEVLPKENVLKALKTIFEHNVMKFKNGTSGAVNGMMPDGSIDISSVHSEEVWVGVTYALAALMIHEGMREEGFFTAEGMYKTLYDKLGLGFQTPEAIYAEKNCRSLGYMRPLSIWGIQWALQHKN